MPVAATLHPVATLLVNLVVSAEDKKPDDNDVVAGGWGALIFVLLILAVVVLAFSLVKQLRRAEEAKAAGVYGDEPADQAPGQDETAPISKPAGPEHP